jgi:threonyl-tRNA synthetase
VIPISDAQAEAAEKLAERLKTAGLRVHVDARGETLNYRIREGEMQKVPYMAVLGQREVEGDSLALRVRGAGKKQEVMKVEEFLARIGEEVRNRSMVP